MRIEVNDALAEEREVATTDLLRRVVIARVLPAVVERLRVEGQLVQEEASAALRRGIGERAAPPVSPEAAAVERPYVAGHRLIALTLSAPLYAAVAGLARASFNNDLPSAAGWLLARGTGLRLALPRRELPVPAPAVKVPTRRQPLTSHDARRFDPDATSARAIVPRRLVAKERTAVRRAPAPDVDAPTGEDLRAHRVRIGLSQKDVALAAGLSRGLVAEVERGRRANSLTRLRISEALAALERAAA